MALYIVVRVEVSVVLNEIASFCVAVLAPISTCVEFDAVESTVGIPNCPGNAPNLITRACPPPLVVDDVPSYACISSPTCNTATPFPVELLVLSNLHRL